MGAGTKVEAPERSRSGLGVGRRWASMSFVQEDVGSEPARKYSVRPGQASQDRVLV